MTTLKMSIAMSALIVTLAPAAQAYATFEEQPSPVLAQLQLALAGPLVTAPEPAHEICEIVIAGDINEAPRVELACIAN